MRLEILQRDAFTCQGCGDKESTLHVHHIYYTPGAEPWEEDAENLMTLCETCHEEETRYWPIEAEKLLNALRRSGFCSGDLETLRKSIEDMPPQIKTNTGRPQ